MTAKATAERPRTVGRWLGQVESESDDGNGFVCGEILLVVTFTFDPTALRSRFGAKIALS
jgi:hypothetical protein